MNSEQLKEIYNRLEEAHENELAGQYLLDLDNMFDEMDRLKSILSEIKACTRPSSRVHRLAISGLEHDDKKPHEIEREELL